MRCRRLDRLAMATVVVAATQVGHLLTSELRGGPAAPGPGAGVHPYLPALATVVLGAAGVAVLAALLVVAAARAVRTVGQVTAPRARRSVLDLAAALFAVQLAAYVVQETLEAVAAGAPPPSPYDLLLWGCVGQLPVAVLAAALLRWLAVSVEAAVADLAAAVGRPLMDRAALAPAGPRPEARPGLRCRPSGSAATGRGPPSLLCPAG